MPSTYKHTTKIFGDPECSEITSYFIFKSANNVIWCIESYDGYVFPIAFGNYNAAKRKLTFTKAHSTFYGFNSGDIIFDVTNSNGKIFITPNRDDLRGFFDDTDNVRLNKCEYMLNPSNKLIGSSWKINDDESEGNLYFKSESKVLINGEPRAYILIGNSVGILSDDNPWKEALVGKCNNQRMELHRSGIRNREYPCFTLDRID